MTQPGVSGVCYIKLGSNLVRSQEGAKLSMGGWEKTPKFANGKLVGFAWKPVASSIEATLVHTADTDIQELQEFQGTVTFETDTGKSFMIADAEVTNPMELTGGEGDLTLKLAGAPAVQQ